MSCPSRQAAQLREPWALAQSLYRVLRDALELLRQDLDDASRRRLSTLVLRLTAVVSALQENLRQYERETDHIDHVVGEMKQDAWRALMEGVRRTRAALPLLAG